MVVLLVIITLLVCCLIDRLLLKTQPSGRVRPAGVAFTDRGDRKRIAGFEFYEGLRYHAGHMWISTSSTGYARIGIDGIAAALIGRIDRVGLASSCGPEHSEASTASHIDAGAECFDLSTRSLRVGLIAPLTGTIHHLNPDILRMPDLVTRDPYGLGWIATVFPDSVSASHRNLIPEALLEHWIQKDATSIQQFNEVLKTQTSNGEARVDRKALKQWSDLVEAILLVQTKESPP